VVLSYPLPFSLKEKKRSRFSEEWNEREKIMKDKNDLWNKRSKHDEFDQSDTHRIECCLSFVMAFGMENEAIREIDIVNSAKILKCGQHSNKGQLSEFDFDSGF
jgi:hypothetical protein